MKQILSWMVSAVLLWIALGVGLPHWFGGDSVGEFGDQFGAATSLFTALAFVVIWQDLRKHSASVDLQEEMAERAALAAVFEDQPPPTVKVQSAEDGNYEVFEFDLKFERAHALSPYLAYDKRYARGHRIAHSALGQSKFAIKVPANRLLKEAKSVSIWLPVSAPTGHLLWFEFVRVVGEGLMFQGAAGTAFERLAITTTWHCRGPMPDRTAPLPEELRSYVDLQWLDPVCMPKQASSADSR